YIFFFFSSRRRHTRFSRDWSSDVCSSDLPPHSWLLPGSDAGRYLRRHYSSSRLPSAKQTFAKGLFQVLNCLHKMKQMVMKNPYRDKAISHYPGTCEVYPNLRI